MANKPVFNPYGDRPIATDGIHGIDVAIQRLDELDRATLAHAGTER